MQGPKERRHEWHEKSPKKIGNMRKQRAYMELGALIYFYLVLFVTCLICATLNKYGKKMPMCHFLRSFKLLIVRISLLVHFYIK